MTRRALVMFACEALCMTRATFLALPPDEQTEWLGHTWNKLTGRYEPPPKR